MSIMGAAVAGMNSDTTWLSTISQNVANANTNGYKTAETNFSALVDQASTTSFDAEGVATNVQNLNSVQGSIVSASSATDLAIQGSGYFVVSNAAGDIFLTRDGTFVPNASGNLVNAEGYTLMGYNIQNGPPTISANSYSGMIPVNIQQAGQQAVATTSGVLSVNLPSTATAVPAANLPSTNTAGATYTEKTSLVAYDNLGGTESLDIYMTKTGANTWEVSVYNAANATNGGFPYSSGPLATQTLTFSGTNGQLTSGSPLAIPVPNGQTLSLNLGGTTQLASGYAVTSASTNGNAPSSITGVSIGTNGELSFNFSNGSTIPGFQIPLAAVASPDNLTTHSGNVFSTNLASGAPQIGIPGTAQFGTIQSSSLEQSTVDLATELTNMIQAQSAYQANSKVFQTGANIIDILNSLKP